VNRLGLNPRDILQYHKKTYAWNGVADAVDGSDTVIRPQARTKR
jgi:hypothetical protein